TIPMLGAALGQGIGDPFAISRDGRSIAYVASQGGKSYMLYARAIGDVSVHEIPGTDGADQPEFSPDGKWLAFMAFGLLKKVPVDGTSPPIVLAQSGSGRGIAWSSSGEIVFGTNTGPLQGLPDGGGPLRTLTTVESDS